MMMNTQDIKKLVDKATQGEWEADSYGVFISVSETEAKSIADVGKPEDRKLIAAAPTIAHQYIEREERLVKLINGWRDKVKDFHDEAYTYWLAECADELETILNRRDS